MSQASPKKRDRLSVVCRSRGYASCRQCGETHGRGLTKCRGCGTVYESGGG